MKINLHSRTVFLISGIALATIGIALAIIRQQSSGLRYVGVATSAFGGLLIFCAIYKYLNRLSHLEKPNSRNRCLPICQDVSSQDQAYIIEMKKAIQGFDRKERQENFVRLVSLSDNPEQLYAPPLTKVMPHLYLGRQLDVGFDLNKWKSVQEREEATRVVEETRKRLQEDQVNSIMVISCMHGTFELEDRYLKGEYYSHPIGDKPNNHEEFNTESILPTLKKIHEARSKGQAVIIHCNGGASRSPSFVIAYLMCLGLTLEEAYDYVVHKRTLVDIKFEEQLRALDVMRLRWELGILHVAEEQGDRALLGTNAQPLGVPQFNAPPTDIWIKTLTGVTINISCYPQTTTIESLRALLGERLLLPPTKIRLVSAGKQLEDGMTLHEFSPEGIGTIYQSKKNLVL